MDSYTQFLGSKIKLAEDAGFDINPSSLHPSSLPHQVDTIVWALKKGRALIGSSFGLGKTHTQIELLRAIREERGGYVMIVCPLGVKHQFTEEDGPRLGVRINYVRNDAEAMVSDSPFLITNYERVRDGHFSAEFLAKLTAVTLDEGSVLRSIGTDTYQQFTKLLKSVPFRFVCTATPAPNKYKELIHYAEFLGVMDSGQALTRWFKRDSQKAGNLTLHPQHEADFWLWVSSWALFLTRPSDLGYSDEGYDLPELRVEWHLITEGESDTHVDKRSGQSEVFASTKGNLQAAAREKKRSIPARVEKMVQLLQAEELDHWLIWHHLEDERRAIAEAVPGVESVFGSQDLELREKLIVGFSHGEFPYLSTKPEIAGSGCNFQKHCSRNVFLGIDYRFEDFIQAVHRTHRFQQKESVQVHIIYTAAEEPIRKELEAKWQRHNELMETMRGIIKTYGLSHQAEKARLTRSLGVEREVAQGKRYTCVHNDCVAELRTMADNSVDLVHTSIPFGNHYEYSASYNDFGHNESNDRFFEQFEFLVPELLRVLKPGRIAAIHVKDRIRYGSVTGNGFMTVERFSDQTSDAFEKGGFVFMGRNTILTDVVRENNQTYRLGWSEQCKDGTKMSYGMPEYVLLFRKLPSDLSNAYADEPVVKNKEEYTRGRWQLDAHALWRSSGDRLLSPGDIRNKSLDTIGKWFKKRNLSHVYDYEEHVRLSEELDSAGRLPSSFMMLPPQSYSEMVATDVVYMRTLNGEQFKRNAQNHICPLPFDIVDRVIRRWSNEDEVVLDPFGGLMTVPFRAVTLGRRGYGIELKKEYWQAGQVYCREAEYKASVPSLFDLLDAETPRKEAA
ncbi:SNF2 family N-terminal domain-containing protein [Hymenobacter gelipurpurascens]|uniref:SNF2 family N-terminal domain-containing protein n=1 Tax=Hymenobacter gelipurpurascens TaxID=89968 RepID=A0A212T9C3_9BACT|nr:DNA methyltransferase [Hymenobacter gelipurpurascens]SNC62394.1 SNF2 family N-terminal domain-containing protein [Hymenobacter gelipurpurascens]